VLERLLATLDHRVSTFRKASEALEALDEAELLLTDVFMPDMDGLELSKRAREARPDLPIVLMSGSMIEATDGLPLLKKPFTRTALSTAIETALAAQT